MAWRDSASDGNRFRKLRRFQRFAQSPLLPPVPSLSFVRVFKQKFHGCFYWQHVFFIGNHFFFIQKFAKNLHFSDFSGDSLASTFGPLKGRVHHEAFRRAAARGDRRKKFLGEVFFDFSMYPKCFSIGCANSWNPFFFVEI